MGGSEALDAPYLEVGFWRMVRKRGGWLSALFLGEMLTATAMGFFEKEIERAVVLALFVPLIISSGGNSGSQATSLVIRSLALRELKLRDWWRVFSREIISGLSLGSLLGTIGFLRIALWQRLHFTNYGPHYYLVAFSVFASLIGVVMFGTVAGSMLPFLLRKLGFDPATASAPFGTTLGETSRNAVFLETVPRRGYRFRARVVSEGRRPFLIHRHRRTALPAGESILGRGEDSLIPIESPSVSRRHARVLITSDEAQLQDLDSKNGTFVRGRKIQEN